MTRKRVFQSARVAIILFCAFLLVFAIMLGAGIRTQPVIFTLTPLLLLAIVIMQLSRPKRS